MFYIVSDLKETEKLHMELSEINSMHASIYFYIHAVFKMCSPVISASVWETERSRDSNLTDLKLGSISVLCSTCHYEENSLFVIRLWFSPNRQLCVTAFASFLYIHGWQDSIYYIHFTFDSHFLKIRKIDYISFENLEIQHMHCTL